MGQDKKYYNSSDGEIRVWVKQESIHIKAADNHGDPVELTKDQALELAAALTQMANSIVD